MDPLTDVQIIPSVCNDGRGVSVFSTRKIDLSGTNARRLSEQQAACNFRLRKSDKHYAADWHVAGDPTLLIILTGTLRISLRNGEQHDIHAGQLFIAEDYLLPDVEFIQDHHGHRAEVIGERTLSALHLKLAKRTELSR